MCYFGQQLRLGQRQDKGAVQPAEGDQGAGHACFWSIDSSRCWSDSAEFSSLAIHGSIPGTVVAATVCPRDDPEGPLAPGRTVVYATTAIISTAPAVIPTRNSGFRPSANAGRGRRRWSAAGPGIFSAVFRADEQRPSEVEQAEDGREPFSGEGGSFSEFLFVAAQVN